MYSSEIFELNLFGGPLSFRYLNIRIYPQIWEVFSHYFFLCLFIFERVKETERGRERICAVSAESDAGLHLRNCEIMT